MRANQFIPEAALGTNPKRPARQGARPERGHEPQKRYVTDRKTGKQYDPDEKFEKTMNSPEVMDQMKRMATKEGWFDSKPATAKVDWNKRAKELFAKGMNEQQVQQQLIKEGCPPNQAPVYVQAGQMEEAVRRSKYWNLCESETCPSCGGKMMEHGPTSKKICLSNVSDDDLGASQLASCKSQGYRARSGKKSHLIGHGKSKVRITVGGKKIKGKEYGGPLPDYGTRKGQ